MNETARAKHIVVTGGAGYVGSILVPHLLSEGYLVTVVDNLMYRQATLLDCCGNTRFAFYRGDAGDADFISRVIAGADVIIPLAAIVGAPACAASPMAASHVNYEAIRLLLNHTGGHQQIIFPTTNSGYGVGEEGKFCTEESPLRPLSLYGRLKVESEQMLLASGRAVSLRLATVFGASPRMRWDLLVNDFTYRACRDHCIVLFEEHFRRNYIHVRDVAMTFSFAIRHFSTMVSQAYNVGLTTANLSKRELCETIRKYVPNLYIHGAPVGEDPDKRDYIVSNAKLEALGWRPQYSLEDGVQELVKAASIAREVSYGNV